MEKNRNIFPLRMESKTTDMVKALYSQDNCASQNEFIEKAVKFYMSYITTEKNTSFLNPMLLTAVQAAISENSSKQATNLFRLAVEVSMMMNLLAYELDMSDEDIKKLRGKCVEDVKKNRSRISFEDAVHFQNGIGFEA